MGVGGPGRWSTTYCGPGGRRKRARAASKDNRSSVRRWPAAMRGPEQVLQVVGRHPFLTADQRVDLLGTTAKRLSALERQLVERGWLRCVSSEELPGDVIGLNGTERRELRFVENHAGWAAPYLPGGWGSIPPWPAATTGSSTVGAARHDVAPVCSEPFRTRWVSTRYL